MPPKFMAKSISEQLRGPHKQPGQVCFVAVLRAVRLPLCILYNIAFLLQYPTKVKQ